MTMTEKISGELLFQSGISLSICLHVIRVVRVVKENLDQSFQSGISLSICLHGGVTGP